MRLAAVAVACLALGASLAAAGRQASFAYGVAAGEITATSARLWTRAPASGRVEVSLAPGRPGASVFAMQARTSADLTAQIEVRGLRPATVYRYRFTQAGAGSEVGTFRTAPLAAADGRVRFGISGDADATRGADGQPGFNAFETYAAIARERNDFNINLGDTIYSDSEIAGAKPALTVAAKRDKYKLGLSLPALRQLRASAGLYSHWDDHEFINDYTAAENGKAVYRAGVRAFTEYAPVTYRPATGLYRTFRWGRHLELFFLDERSFRSGKVDDVCGTDLAPTAPAAVRAGFAQLAPALAQPVTQACLDALADPGRTMLGGSQEAAFLRAVKASDATFKVIVNEVPLMQLYALPYDRWEGYGAARERLLAGLAGVTNVVVLTTDTHAHLIGEIRTRTLEEGGPVGTGIWEVVTGPVATNTYSKEIDVVLGAQGTGTVITGLFFKQPPPRGLGLACAATDTFGYSEVTVTATLLTVTPKSSTGRRVNDVNGAPCAPLTVTAR